MYLLMMCSWRTGKNESVASAELSIPIIQVISDPRSSFDPEAGRIQVMEQGFLGHGLPGSEGGEAFNSQSG